MDRDRGWVNIRVRPLDGAANEVFWEFVTGANMQIPRWHIANGSLWLDTVHSPEIVGASIHTRREYFNRMDARELYLRKEPTSTIDAEGSTSFVTPNMDHTFGSPFLPGRYRWASNFCEFDTVIHSDCLSAEPGHVRNFLLSNVRNAIGSVHRGDGTKLVGSRLGFRPGDRVKPFWNMTVYSCKAKWDPKAKEWDDGGKWWQREQSLEVSFHEPFRVFGKGDDYYFLTDSGSLYWAPPSSKKGWTRRVTRVYDGGKRRVVAVVTDADAKRTFLFLDAQREGKPAFFELSDEPRLVEYDPKLVPLPPAAEPNRTMLHRARILVALKKIEGKLPAKEKP